MARPMILRSAVPQIRTLVAPNRITAFRWHATAKSSNNNDWSTVVPTSFAIGSAAGVMGSLAGMGGGFVMIPLMTSSLLKLTQHQAHGTSLFAVMSTGLAGAMSYGKEVDYESAFAIALSGMFAARAGARLTAQMSDKMLKRALGWLMLAMAPAVPGKAYLIEHYGSKAVADVAGEDSHPTIEGESVKEKSLTRFLAPATIGLASGFLAGVFGVGGGVVVVPALAIATDMNHYQALATSLAAMTPPAAVGTYTHYVAGNVVMRVAPPLALGAFFGAYLGGQLGQKTSESTLQWGFSGLLTAMGVRTILRA